MAFTISRLLLQIHDELVWEVPDEHITKAKGIFKLMLMFDKYIFFIKFMEYFEEQNAKFSSEVIQQTMEDTHSLCAQFCTLQVPLSVTITRGKSWAHMEPFG